MKRTVSLTLKVFILFAVQLNIYSQTATAPAAGDGTPGNPYQIQTLNNLYWLSQNSSEWDKHYVQTANIDAAVSSGWDGGKGFTPIGNISIPFTGTFKGYVFTISNLYINRPDTDYVGLFGYTYYADIENVGVVNITATGRNYVGGLIGWASDLSINNSYVTGNVVGNNNAGGLSGCVTTLSAVLNCYSIVNVSGNDKIGGLIGEQIGSDIYHSYSAGSVTGAGADVGGLIGRLQTGTVTDSFWDTETSGQAISAGGTGKTTTEMKNAGTFGSVGWNMSYCWAISGATNNGYPFLLNPFLPASIAPSAGNGTLDNPYCIETLENLVWLSQNSDQWNKHYIQIADIDAATSFTGGWHNGYGFSPIGNSRTYFTGSYDGNNHSISDLYINRPLSRYVGLFGGTLSCTINNLGVEDVSITGKEYVGGLAGASEIIFNCYSSGSVKGKSRVGGLTGSASRIANSYSTADVEGGYEVGGLTGWGSTIINSYSTGSISGDGNLGGLVGTSGGSATNSFWDTETSGMATSAAGTGKTTAEMKTQSTFTNAGWNFTYCWNLDGSTNNGYPFLRNPFIPASVAPVSGDGTAQNPWVIQSLENLVWLSKTRSQWNKYFIQVADIDAALSFSEGWYNGYGFSPIGKSMQISFTGSYNGNNHTISNLYINRPDDYISLFGYVSGTIKNLAIENADITGIGCVGAIAGQANGSAISNCNSTGSVGGEGSIGGLAGALSYAAIIQNCNSSVSVSGNSNIGGLVGYNYNSAILTSSASGNVGGNTNVGGLSGINYEATINNCYSTSIVSGITENTGGLVGYNYTGAFPLVSSSINNSYSAGSVTGSSNTGGLVGNSNSATSNSFWDTESSGQATSTGGTGITTAEMKNVATFTDINTVGLDIAWDFKGNPNDDILNEDIWNIVGTVNNGYPCLRWQLNQINNQPASQTICEGENVVLSILASGIDVSYQWKMDGDVLAGETGDTLKLNAISTEDGGSYACVVTTDYDTLTSETAILTILDATEITVQPEDKAVNAGETVWFNLNAAGINLNYKWLKNGTAELQSSASSSLQIADVGSEDVGEYFCVVTGDCGEDTSQVVTLSINPIVDVIKTNSLLNDWLVFPNPTDGLVTIENREGSLLSEKTRITITNVTGKVISEIQCPAKSKKFVITELVRQAVGIYFIKIVNNENVTVVRIVKN